MRCYKFHYFNGFACKSGICRLYLKLLFMWYSGMASTWKKKKRKTSKFVDAGSNRNDREGN